MAVRGACLCGRLEYAVEGPFRQLAHCHCSMCRKAHGAAFASFVAAPAAGFRWRSGERDVRGFESSPGAVRGFCPTCGGVAPMAPPGADSVYLPAGNLDGELGVKPEAHYYVASRASWDAITDDAAQHDTGFPEPQVPARPRPSAAADALAGSCLCGDVAYQIERPLQFLVHCHCSRCRRSRSAAYGTNTVVERDAFRWLQGADAVRDFALPGAQWYGTAFCPRCGSLVPRALADGARYLIPIPALDDEPGLLPQLHIFVGSKANWFEIGDTWPQHTEGPA